MSGDEWVAFWARIGHTRLMRIVGLSQQRTGDIGAGVRNSRFCAVGAGLDNKDRLSAEAADHLDQHREGRPLVDDKVNFVSADGFEGLRCSSRLTC